MTTYIDYNEDDLLNGQLFIASKSKTVQHTRRKNWLILLGCSVFCFIAFYIGNNQFLMYYSLIMGVIVLCFYPLYQRYIYKRHYRRFIIEKFKKFNDLDYRIEITPDAILTQNKLGNMFINTAQIKYITETGRYFFVELSTGDVLTLPKRSFNYNNLLQQLTSIATSGNIPFDAQLNWKWR